MPMTAAATAISAILLNDDEEVLPTQDGVDLREFEGFCEHVQVIRCLSGVTGGRA